MIDDFTDYISRQTPEKAALVILGVISVGVIIFVLSIYLFGGLPIIASVIGFFLYAGYRIISDDIRSAREADKRKAERDRML